MYLDQTHIVKVLYFEQIIPLSDILNPLFNHPESAREDSNQTVHPSGLIKVFSFRIKFASLAIQNAPNEESGQNARMHNLCDLDSFVPIVKAICKWR